MEGRNTADIVALDCRAASLHLKITPELLFYYVRHGAKGSAGRKLRTLDGGNATLFLRQELDDFDRYLQEPWARPNEPRPSIPKGVRDYLKIEAGGMCARCGEGAPLQDAHIVEWETSRSHYHHNLVRLCGNCHGLYDSRLIPRPEIERIKAEAIDRLQRRVENAPQNWWPIVAAPPMIPDLLGREAEMAEAIDALRSGESLCILGLGGIGKTQLALHTLHRAASGRPIVWIGIDLLRRSASITDAFITEARRAGIEVRNEHPLLDEQRACVVLDGIERLGGDGGRDDVTDFLERLLTEQADTQIVVTSQTTLPQIRFDRTLKLGPLGAEESKHIMLDDGRAPFEPPAVERLLQIADGHPLTLRIIAALIRHLGSARAVADRLAEQGAEALAIPRRRSQSDRTSLNQCLELAYSQLGEAEKRLLWLIAASPSGLRPGLHRLKEMIGADSLDTARELDAWNLITAFRDNRFLSGAPPSIILSMLSPVRAFALFAADNPPREDQAFLELSFCQSMTFMAAYIYGELLQGQTIEVGNALMERELDNIMSAFDLAFERAAEEPEYRKIPSMIADATMMSFFMSGRFEEGQSLMRRASSIEANFGSLQGALQFLYQMQTLAQRSRNKKAAALALAEAEAIGLGAEGLALSLLRLIQASAAEIAGDYDRAAQLARDSHAIQQTLPSVDGDWKWPTSFQLARALEFGGRADEALPFFREALDIAEANDDPLNQGSIWHHIGNCEAFAGKWQSAMHAYRKAAELFIELEVVEFISNALGEAGRIVAYLDPLVGLPSRDAVIAGLDDAIAQFDPVFDRADVEMTDVLVRFRKLSGLIALALHTGNRDLLAASAEELYARFIEPLTADVEPPPDMVRFCAFNIQWTIRLLQFLYYGIGNERPLSASEVFVLGQLAGNGFTMDAEQVSEWLASYLRRRCGMSTTSPEMLSIMNAEEEDPTVRSAMAQAEADGVDLGWLR